MRSYPLTLTPNRSPGPPRVSRLVVYRPDAVRGGDPPGHLGRLAAFDMAVGVGGVCRAERRPLRTIAREDPTSTAGVDREFLSAWREHVRAEGARAPARPAR